MKTTYFSRLVVSITMIMTTVLFAQAKDYSIALSCDPDGATVYLNGQLVSQTTPSIIDVPKKTATKTMMFQFVKDGYISKTITVAYTKQQLKANPIVYCTLQKANTTQKTSYTDDPTVTTKQTAQRVDRHNAGKTDLEKTILRWYFDSDPRGARVYYRVISSVPSEVKNTNESYLTTTPYEETKSFNILGLTYDNSRDVTIEIKVTKRGHEDQIKRYNVRQAIDQQEISGFFELVPKDDQEPATAKSRKKKTTTVTEVEEEEE